MDQTAYTTNLIELAKSSFEGTMFTVHTPFKPYDLWNTIPLDNSIFIELRPGIWCLTDFIYSTRFFRYVDQTREGIDCFVEMSPQQDCSGYEQVMRQMHIIDNYNKYNRNIEALISIVLNTFNTANQKILSIRNRMNEMSITLENNQYTFTNFRPTAICYFKDRKAYQQQLHKWNIFRYGIIESD